MSPNVRLVLLHYHILKNGGSSMAEILRRSFWGTFCEYDVPDRDAEIKSPDLLSVLERNPQVNAFSSHQIFYPVPKAPGFLFFDICFLRDPIDRIRSIYDYFRGKPVDEDPIRQLAYRHTLGEFTRRLIEEMPWTVNDVQVNLLANGIVNDQPRGMEDLDLATQRMLETPFLGVVDRYGESLVAGQSLIHPLFPTLNCVQAPVNDSATPGSTLAERLEQFKNSCDSAVFSELQRLNAMDFELLRRARDEVRRRFERVPEHEERLRELKKGVAILQARESNPGEPIIEQEPVSPLPKVSKRTDRVTAPSPNAPGTLVRLMRALRFALNLRAMRPGSEFRRLFDANYYCESYTDVAGSGTNPLWHFVTRGAFEGRNPHPLFDTNFYLSQCSCRPQVNALCDYVQRGDAKGLRPNPLFDPEYYRRRYPDVRDARMNTLLHYILHGAAERRKPHPLFHPEYYLAACPDARNVENPLVHFMENEECLSPHPLFDCESYRHAHAEEAGNPLVAYLTRPHSHDPVETGHAIFDAARLSIEEVEVLIIFPDEHYARPKPEQHRIYAALQASAARDGFPGEVAVLWRDGSGAKTFLCAPQQRRFFECVRYDQLAAQVNGTLAIP